MRITQSDYLEAIAGLARELVDADRERALQHADLLNSIARQMPAESARAYRLRADAIVQAAAEQTAELITKAREQQKAKAA